MGFLIEADENDDSAQSDGDDGDIGRQEKEGFQRQDVFERHKKDPDRQPSGGEKDYEKDEDGKGKLEQQIQENMTGIHEDIGLMIIAIFKENPDSIEQDKGEWQQSDSGDDEIAQIFELSQISENCKKAKDDEN